MTPRRVPLWAAGVAAWPLVTGVAAAVIPPEPGPSADRPFGWALVVGGLCSLPFLIADFVRDRRVWLGTLIVWGTLFCLGVVDGIGSVDSDFDQEIGWAFVLPGLIAGPVFVISLIAETWARRKRRWRVEFEGSKIVFVRRPDDSG